MSSASCSSRWSIWSASCTFSRSCEPMQTLPYWLQVIQALATPAIALLAAVIGIAQWRTARHRVILDLFDKRWTVLTDLREVVGDVVRERKLTIAIGAR